MTPRFSIYLDFLRFFAAIIVFVSHFAYARFTGGDYLIIRELNLGSDAVVFFFVLSGLVIAYTADIKDKTLKQYSFHRFTRLYSVIIPALFLTVIMDSIGQSISPENYDGWWFNDSSVWEELFRGMTLTNEWANQHFRIGTNGPYWSLSYEAAYYILFGVGFYLSGLKKLLLLLPLILVFNISVMLLLPVWLIGLWAYKQIKINALPDAYGWACVIIPPLIYVVLLSIGLPEKLLIITKLVLGIDFVNSTLGFSNEFVWNLILAQLIAFHLIGMSKLSKKNLTELSKKTSSAIRWCAGGTFTIYVVHYPALQFMDTVLPEMTVSLMRHIALFVSVLIICFLFAEISERRLKWFRKKLSR